MKRFLVASTLTASLCIVPVTIHAETTSQHSTLVIETDHTFTITFSQNVAQHEQLLKHVTILTDNKTIAYTPKTEGVIMTLDPTVDLQPSKSYTVEVELTTGETFKRNFLTKALVETPVTQFIEKHPDYNNVDLLKTMQEQLQQAEDPNADPSVQAAVTAIPKQLQAFEKIIANAQAFEQLAAKKADAATANEFDVAMMSESLSSLINTHIENSPSVDVLTALQQTWTNASLLVGAAEQANEYGVELLAPLEELNNAIAEFILTTPFPAQASSAQLVKDLQKLFDANVANVTASESKINAQITAIEKLVDTASDYTLSLDDANYVLEDIQAYQQQFKSFENATAIMNAPATYKQFQTAINTISSRLASSSNIATLETTITNAAATADNAASKLVELIDLYLEKEVEKLHASLEAVEKEADAKDIDYITLDSYYTAYEAVEATDWNYTYYDDFMTWTDIQKAFSDANAAVKAVRDELNKL
ncbi:MAG: Ig-like domain-containing protein [Caryophanon sp.]|nr:Ig-like domain-containing protein [Caryophanon sp.]